MCGFAQNWPWEALWGRSQERVAHGEVTPCHFYLSKWSTGLFQDVVALIVGMFNVKSATMVPNNSKALRVLSRSTQWAAQGFVYDSDHICRPPTSQVLGIPVMAGGGYNGVAACGGEKKNTCASAGRGLRATRPRSVGAASDFSATAPTFSSPSWRQGGRE